MFERSPPAPPPHVSGPDDLDILLTAAEAYPAFERAVLAAEHEIVAGFRIFDFSTKLRTPEALEIGTDWFDLMLHTVRRGVSVRMVLSDFDPVVGTELHGGTWRSMAMAIALNELAGDAGRLQIMASLHPASVGAVAKVALLPQVRALLDGRLRRTTKRGDRALSRFLARHPRFAALTARTGGRLRPRIWPLPSLWPVTHHQKVAVIDGAVTYIGGLDLNERRWDTLRHDGPSDETWHDVQLLVRNAEVSAATKTHLEEFVAAIEGAAPPSDLGGVILRTLSAKAEGRPSLFAPRPVLAEIEAALLAEIARAERFIYIETQFLRDRRIARALARRAREQPSLEVMVVLPGAPEDVAYMGATRSDARFGEYLQFSCIRKLRRAFRGRIFVGSPVQPRTAQGTGRDTLHGAPLVYVHAKVCVIDDAFAMVGSANLNGRSLRWDTELAVPIRDRAIATHLRERCLRHWCGDMEDVDAFLSPETAVRAWQRLALENARRKPETRKGFLVPYLTGPARRFGRSLPAMPEEIV
ncbi:phospholipase D family protein [Jannaschia sp. KMU-145]|uniref:phospholipase D family protein n=1 Tax=Jannaschia halovivens TaxID=3388667 RepID=UPI00396B2227